MFGVFHKKMDKNGVTAIAEYEYNAKEPDELSLIKGAIILNVKEQPGGWWEGTLNGKTGVFPDSFVRLINNNNDEKNSVVVMREKSATSNRRCKVVYSYTQNNEDELSLSVGEVIEFLGEVEEGWWKGKLGNKVGVFPSNFVVTIEKLSPVLANKRGASTAAQTKKNLSNSRENLVESSISPNIITSNDINRDAPTLPPKPVRELCKALFPYEPVNEDELELAEGDIVTILSKDLPDKGWWKGELKGKIGVFPDNFVSILGFDESPSKDKPERPPLSNKLLINKSPNSSVTNSHRKDSFGSKDSLNDSGIIVGNVAAHRLSLETRTISVVETIVDKQPSKKGLETKSNSDIRKSLENLDERKSTPPPVLFKKPVVPIKKSPTVTSVTGNILGGIKQKVKSVEHKLYSHDSFDGIGSSKMGTPQVADTNEKGIIGERIRKEDLDFDHVERGSILQDMRAGRARAPKRRPPTAGVVNTMTDNNNITTIHNGGGGESQTDDDVAKPKPREWEKHKAPWMDELKASQAKKTSPNDTKSPEINSASGDGLNNDMSKSFSSAYVASHRKSSESTSTFEVRANSVEVKSSTFDNQKKEIFEPTTTSMTKSMSSINAATKISISTDNSTNSTTNITTDDTTSKIRPVSVNLRNRSISPISRTAKSMHTSPDPVKFTHSNNDTITIITQDNVCSHVTDIELRVRQLEKIIQMQNLKIDDLIRLLKDEKEKK